MNTTNSKTLFILAIIWAILLLLIGTWWIYLFANFEHLVIATDQEKLIKMITWEGGTFLVLLILLSSTILTLYIKDIKKTASLQTFFASLSHELKTPLASIRLQGDVINEIIQTTNDQYLKNLIGRLIEDTSNLENELDKILQLSRIERGGELNIVKTNLNAILKSVIKKNGYGLEITINSNEENIEINADEFALELIFKNLIENTKKHTDSKKVQIDIINNPDEINIIFNDFGKFEGDHQKLGNLFYKYNSKKGSGIGLYLVKLLTQKMNGNFKIIYNQGLLFNLTFPRGDQ